MSTNIITSEQITQTVESITQTIEEINSKLKFKADSTLINHIKQDSSRKIQEFTNYIEEINSLLSNKQGKTNLVKGFIPSDNETIIIIYKKLVEKIKVSRKKRNYSGLISSGTTDYTESITLDPNSGISYNFDFYYPKYYNLTSPIMNSYLTYLLGELLCLNICFTLFEKITNTGGIMSKFNNQLINNLFNTMIQQKNLLSSVTNNNLFLTLSVSEDKLNYNCLNFGLSNIQQSSDKINNIRVSIDNNENIHLPERFSSSLEFNIGFEYEEYINEKKYDRCIIVSGKDYQQFDPDHFISGEKPSLFRIKFKISDVSGNIFNNNIVFDIEHYKCTYNFISSYRYRFTVIINGNKYILSEIDNYTRGDIYELTKPNILLN